MAKKKNYQTKGIGSGIVAFGAAFALYSAIFKPHSIGGFVLAFALCGFLGAIVRIMAQGLDLSTPEKNARKPAEGTGRYGQPRGGCAAAEGPRDDSGDPY